MNFFKKRNKGEESEVDYSIDYESLEGHSNRFTVRCLLITYFFMAFMWVLDLLGIFIVDKGLMNYGFFLLSFLVLLLIAICKLVGYNKSWLKYVIIIFAVLMTDVLAVVLT